MFLECPIDKKWTLVQIMAWCRTGDMPLRGPMLTHFLDAYTISFLRWVHPYGDGPCFWNNQRSAASSLRGQSSETAYHCHKSNQICIKHHIVLYHRSPCRKLSHPANPPHPHPTTPPPPNTRNNFYGVLQIATHDTAARIYLHVWRNWTRKTCYRYTCINEYCR